MDSKKQSTGAILAIMAGVCWGVISIFIKKLNAEGLDSFQIMTYRAWFAAAMLLAYMAFRDRNLLKLKLKDIWIFLGSGLLSLTFFSYCYFTNIIRSGAAIAVVMLYTSPIFVMILSILFFKEKMTKAKGGALIMTFIGCGMVSGLVEVITTGGRLDGVGILLGLGSGFGYALYSLFAGFAIKRGYASITISFYTFLFSGISLIFITGPARTIEGVTLSTLPWILGAALLCTVIPYLAYTAGMQRIEISKAAVLVTVEPLVGALLGIVAYGEPAGLLKIIGIVLILLSVGLLNKAPQNQS